MLGPSIRVTLAALSKCLSMRGLRDSSRVSCLVRGRLHRHTIMLMKLKRTPLVKGDGDLALMLPMATALVRNLATILPRVGTLHMLRKYLCVALNRSGKPPIM